MSQKLGKRCGRVEANAITNKKIRNQIFMIFMGGIKIVTGAGLLYNIDKLIIAIC